MPGISLVIDIDGGLETQGKRLRSSLDSLMHYPGYEQKIPVHDDHLFLGYTRHAKYPVTVFETDDSLICLEGRLYGRKPDEVREELANLENRLAGDAFGDDVSRWILSRDGDFVILVQNKRTREIAIVNDALGRLPLYSHIAGGRIIVSREVRFIADLLDERRFDRMAIAQYLLFGYPLGERTLLEGISRLQPSTVIRAHIADRDVAMKSLSFINFEHKPKSGSDIREKAAILADLFTGACARRGDAVDSNVITLSGGLDSRAVAAGLKRTETAFAGATFLDHYGTAAPDIEYARQIADALDFEWKLFRLGRTKGSDVLKLLEIKNGMNHLGMSFSIPYFHEIMNTYGNRITYFTGDGGDKTLPDIRPARMLKDIDALCEYILENNQTMPLDTVSSITGIDRGDIVTDLRNHVAGYPEKEMSMKYVRFLIFERSFKWLFEGEDRNRFFFWTVTPFYSNDFFMFALFCPDDLKSRYRLYREFLLVLSPKASDIVNVKWNMPITSDRLKFYFFAKDVYSAMPAGIRKAVKRRYKKPVGGYAADSNVVRCLTEQLEGCGPVSDYLSAGSIREHINSFDKTGFDNLFTVTSAIEDFLCGGSSIDRYRDLELI